MPGLSAVLRIAVCVASDALGSACFHPYVVGGLQFALPRLHRNPTRVVSGVTGALASGDGRGGCSLGQDCDLFGSLGVEVGFVGGVCGGFGKPFRKLGRAGCIAPGIQQVAGGHRLVEHSLTFAPGVVLRARHRAMVVTGALQYIDPATGH